MANFYSVGVNRIIYKAENFTAGKTVTAYFWNPSLERSALQTFFEVSDGLYYLDYDFAASGTHFGLFYENDVKKAMGIFRVTALKATIDKLDDTFEDDDGVYRFTENALEQAPSGTGGDATAANQATIINHLTDVKGTGFVRDSNSLVNVTDDLAAVDTGIADLQRLIEADKIIDTSGSPWVLEIRDKDTKEVLLRQTMKNTNGEVITNINNVLGQLEKE